MKNNYKQRLEARRARTCRRIIMHVARQMTSPDRIIRRIEEDPANDIIEMDLAHSAVLERIGEIVQRWNAEAWPFDHLGDGYIDEDGTTIYADSDS